MFVCFVFARAYVKHVCIVCIVIVWCCVVFCAFVVCVRVSMYLRVLFVARCAVLYGLPLMRVV